MGKPYFLSRPRDRLQGDQQRLGDLTVAAPGGRGAADTRLARREGPRVDLAPSPEGRPSRTPSRMQRTSKIAVRKWDNFRSAPASLKQLRSPLPWQCRTRAKASL